jgi:hypothetical protein
LQILINMIFFVFAGTVVGLGNETARPACKKCGYP